MPRVMVDATEVPQSMPIDWAAQRAAWSGKTKDHVVKATVLADASRRPIWFEANPTGEGRTHDATVLRSQLGLLAVLSVIDANVLVHKAYRGMWHELGERVVVPQLTPKGTTKTAAQPEREHELSRQRMPVEHAVGRMKSGARAALLATFPPDHLDLTGKAIAVLASIT